MLAISFHHIQFVTILLLFLKAVASYVHLMFVLYLIGILSIAIFIPNTL